VVAEVGTFLFDHAEAVHFCGPFEE